MLKAITGGSGGGGAVSSVSNVDGTLTISPTIGDIVASRAEITGDASIPVASNALTLATVNASPGAYTYASLTVNGKGLVTAASSGTAPAPNNATYVTLTTDATLTNERTLAVNASVFNLTDGGAGGNVVIGLVTQAKNTIFSGPTTGADATPTFRAMVAADLPAIADHTVLANISGGSASPSSTTLSNLIDNALGSTRGAVLERGASGWQIIAPGASGTVFTSNGAAADPSYQVASGGISLGKAYAVAAGNFLF